MKGNVFGTVVAGALAGLVMTGVSFAQAGKHPAAKAAAPAAGGEKIHCVGTNACKGKGECKTAGNECKGKNACKGHGWNSMSAEECTKKGGKPAE